MKLNPDGSAGIDFEKLVAEAIRIGNDERVEWQVESTHTESHPMQGPLPEDRRRFDPHSNER